MRSQVIVALDFDQAAKAQALVAQLDPEACKVKVGKELFCAAGPEFVRQLVDRGFDVFLDLKFHDIPNTVAGACRVAKALGVWMVNVHAGGGRRMLEAAREALGPAQPGTPLLIAVTCLTSLSDQDLRDMGERESADEKVMRLARLAFETQMDGVVCSPRDAAKLKASHGADFRLVTPGIRPASAEADDQRRTLSPGEAQAAGAEYLVIGRPITAAANPLHALQQIRQELASA